MTREREGVLLSLLSAAAYSTSAIFARLGYVDGVGLVELLAGRYVGAAIVFWLLVARAGLSLPGRRAATTAVLLGLVVFSAQSGLFFSALQRIDAALAVLLLYAYPALVAIGAILLGRERANLRRFVALAVAMGGIALVLSGDGDLAGDLLGALLALGAALAYTVYILVGHGLMRTVPPLVLAALTCSGAAVTYVAVGLGASAFRFDFGPVGWATVVGVTLLSTVVAVGASFAAVMRVGPTVTSIVTTAEIPLGVLLAATILGERLGPLQLLGGALVVSAVLLVQVPLTLPRRRSQSAKPAAVRAAPTSTTSLSSLSPDARELASSDEVNRAGGRRRPGEPGC